MTQKNMTQTRQIFSPVWGHPVCCALLPQSTHKLPIISLIVHVCHSLLNRQLQVLTGLHYPSSWLAARAEAFACRAGMHKRLGQPSEAFQDCLEALKVHCLS